jgi:hypothetical protein
MKQYFSHYLHWEDFQNGMYTMINNVNESELIELSVNLLSNKEGFYICMQQLIIEWPVATKVNLTNQGQNRRAWLGAAACCFNHQCPELLTRTAWGLLNTEQQNQANQAAESIILKFESTCNYEKNLFE